MTEERFPAIAPEAMTEAQARMVQSIAAGPRGAGLRGPFKALLQSPELGDRVQRVGAYIRYDSTIPQALNEMAILIAGRKWNAQYEFYAHRKLGLAAGLRPEVADAIAEGKRPPDMDADETLIWNFCTELLNTTEVSDASFKAVVNRFGQRGAIDLVGAVGYYSLVSMILNVDRVQLPPGETPPLKKMP